MWSTQVMHIIYVWQLVGSYLIGRENTYVGRANTVLKKLRQNLNFQGLLVKVHLWATCHSTNIVWQFLFLGFLDSTDIHIKQQIQHLAAHTNRKSVTSVKLQGVCDTSLKFMDISCGWSGSMHDSLIFGMSSLSRVIEEKLRQNNYHLLCDSAYRLGRRLITPYRNNGHLTPVIMFNTKIIGF